jgi:hypothetical protein
MNRQKFRAALNTRLITRTSAGSSRLRGTGFVTETRSPDFEISVEESEVASCVVGRVKQGMVSI